MVIYVNKNQGITGLLLCLCLLSLALTGSGEEVTPSSDTVTIVDYTGQSVEVPYPVDRVVSLSSSASEIICALGASDKIIGRGSSSIFPPYIEDVPIVGKSSYTPSIELIIELDPDVLIADTMLTGDNREMIEAAGIPVIEESFVDPPRVTSVMSNLGLILDKEERAGELISFIDQYQSIIEERTADSRSEDKPAVFLERGQPYHTASASTSSHNCITTAGGINIASGESVKYPTVSPEWVVEMNPEIIVRSVWATTGETFTREDLKEVSDELLSRPGLSEVKAVKDGRVHVYSSKINSGVRSIVGELYFAKWFHPAVFEDIDPEAVHRDLVQKFYGLELEGVYVYP